MPHLWSTIVAGSALPIHTAQLLTYLSLTNRPVGLLINFNVPILKNGIHRVVNARLADRRPPAGDRA
jgi:hypothetical protein